MKLVHRPSVSERPANSVLNGDLFGRKVEPHIVVIPAKAGTQTGPMPEGCAGCMRRGWIPAFAGMTIEFFTSRLPSLNPVAGQVRVRR
jgi:hypothetical protein